MPGPAPKPNDQRRRRNAPRANTVKLPAEGRKGPAPKWPMPTFKPSSWDEIWSLPQAVMWEAQHSEMVVARYVDLREKVMNPDFPEGKSPSFWTTLTQLEDRLGLTPMALMKLQWEIEGTTEGDEQDQAPDAAQGGTVTRIDGVRKRLQGKSS